jgi:lysozyme family protein
MPVSLAREIYRRRYIVEPCFDKVTLIDEKIGMELIDTGVNMGPSRAGEFLQRWLNGFNAGGSHYQDVFVDGRVGQITLDALRAFLRWRGADGSVALLRGLNGVQAARYLELAENDKRQRKFLFGWVLQRVSAA